MLSNRTPSITLQAQEVAQTLHDGAAPAGVGLGEEAGEAARITVTSSNLLGQYRPRHSSGQKKTQPQRSNLCDSIASSRHSSKRESVETLTANGSSLDTQRRQPVMGIVQSHGDIVLHGDCALKRLST
jgi:hypothetical protein